MSTPVVKDKFILQERPTPLALLVLLYGTHPLKSFGPTIVETWFDVCRMKRLKWVESLYTYAEDNP